MDTGGHQRMAARRPAVRVPMDRERMSMTLTFTTSRRARMADGEETCGGAIRLKAARSLWWCSGEVEVRTRYNVTR